MYLLGMHSATTLHHTESYPAKYKQFIAWLPKVIETWHLAVAVNNRDLRCTSLAALHKMILRKFPIQL